MKTIEYTKEKVQMLADHWKKGKIAEPVMKIYLKFLIILSKEEFDRAIELWLFTGKGFPTPEEILGKAGKSPRQDADVQWLRICQSQPRNAIAQECSETLKPLAQLRGIESLPAKEYSYKENQVKNIFAEKYTEIYLAKLSDGTLTEALIEFDPHQKKEPKEGWGSVFEPITSEQLASLRSRINAIGQRIGNERLGEIDF